VESRRIDASSDSEESNPVQLALEAWLRFVLLYKPSTIFARVTGEGASASAESRSRNNALPDENEIALTIATIANGMAIRIPLLMVCIASQSLGKRARGRVIGSICLAM
jgi:hypothetical protein